MLSCNKRLLSALPAAVWLALACAQLHADDNVPEPSYVPLEGAAVVVPPSDADTNALHAPANRTIKGLPPAQKIQIFRTMSQAKVELDRRRAEAEERERIKSLPATQPGWMRQHRTELIVGGVLVLAAAAVMWRLTA